MLRQRERGASIQMTQINVPVSLPQLIQHKLEVDIKRRHLKHRGWEIGQKREFLSLGHNKYIIVILYRTQDSICVLFFNSYFLYFVDILTLTYLLFSFLIYKFYCNKTQTKIKIYLMQSHSQHVVHLDILY